MVVHGVYLLPPSSLATRRLSLRTPTTLKLRASILFNISSSVKSRSNTFFCFFFRFRSIGSCYSCLIIFLANWNSFNPKKTDYELQEKYLFIWNTYLPYFLHRAPNKERKKIEKSKTPKFIFLSQIFFSRV